MDFVNIWLASSGVRLIFYFLFSSNECLQRVVLVNMANGIMEGT